MFFNGLVVANRSPFLEVHSGSSISTRPTRFRLSMSTVGESAISLYIVMPARPKAMLSIPSSGYDAGSIQLHIIITFRDRRKIAIRELP